MTEATGELPPVPTHDRRSRGRRLSDRSNAEIAGEVHDRAVGAWHRFMERNGVGAGLGFMALLLVAFALWMMNRTTERMMEQARDDRQEASADRKLTIEALTEIRKSIDKGTEVASDVRVASERQEVLLRVLTQADLAAKRVTPLEPVAPAPPAASPPPRMVPQTKKAK